MNEQTSPAGQSSQEQGRCCGPRHGCGNGHKRGRCVAKILGMLLVFGLGFFAGKSYSCEPGFNHGPAAFMSGHSVDAEQMGKFAERRVQHLLSEVDASSEQKAKASTIVKAALEQGQPLAEKMRDNHQQLHKLMSAASLDKAAIENLRADQLRLADEASKLATQTLENVAEVLTPEQRAKLAEKMDHHGHWLHS